MKFFFNDLKKGDDLDGLLQEAIDAAIKKGFEMGGDNALVGMRITHPKERKPMGPVLVDFYDKERMTVEKVFNTVKQMQQSNDEFQIDGEMNIQVFYI
jgi:hypothetical protein